MAQNFIECAHEQAFLMPPDVREWLPERHLAWSVIDAVADLRASAAQEQNRGDADDVKYSAPKGR